VPFTLTVDASTSTDTDGAIVDYSWNFGDGWTGSGAQSSHTYFGSDTFTVSLTVTDDKGATGGTTALVVVAPRNVAPTASMVAPATGITGQALEFDGTASADPDGTIANYTWYFGDGTSASGPRPTHVYATPGTFTVALWVTDNNGATNSTYRTVLAEVPNVLPVASFTTTAAQGLAPLSLTFNAGASTDSDGSIASYAWDFGDGATGTGRTAAHTYASAGTFVAVLTVTDNRGGTASSSTTITVAANQPPSAGFTMSPSAGQAPLLVNVDASASTDVDGVVAGYAWDFGDGSSDTGPTASHSYASGGVFTVTLTTTDDMGATSTSSKTLTVDPPNVAPTPVLISSSSIGQAPAALTFSGASSSDPDGTVAAYAWDFGDGSSSTSASPGHTFSTAGTFTVRLTVSDNQGATATTATSVTVIRSPYQRVSVLNRGETMVPNDTIVSNNRQHSLKMQQDGNLVLDGSWNWTLWPIWQSKAGPSAPIVAGTDPYASFTFQNDGNAAIYAPGANGRLVWNSGTGGLGGVRIVVQDDGNIVMFNSADVKVWSSGSFQRFYEPGGPVFVAGHFMQPDTTGNIRLIMQGDGNLVVYKNGAALWSTGTNNNPGAYMNVLADGRFVVFSKTGAVLWQAVTNYPGAVLVLQPDGNLRMKVAPGGAVLWETGRV
jgi:PKD repeat protein